MKRILLALCSFVALTLTQGLSAQQLESEFLFELEADLNPPQVVGPVLTGQRSVYLVSKGSVKGSKVSGKILPGGGDWGLLVGPNTFKLDVRLVIETDDGALIYMTYGGYIHAEPKTFAALFSEKGGQVPASDFYFRSNPVFETSSPKYAWLNHTLAIGVGSIPAQGKVAYRVYQIK